MNSHQRRILRRSLGDMPRLPYVQMYGRAIRPIKSDAEVDAQVAVLRANPPVELATFCGRNIKGEFGIAADTPVVTNAKRVQVTDALEQDVATGRLITKPGYGKPVHTIAQAQGLVNQMKAHLQVNVELRRWSREFNGHVIAGRRNAAGAIIWFVGSTRTAFNDIANVVVK